MNSQLNTNIKIFSELYVGLKDQGINSPKLGFATPLEKGAAFIKRKSTVDNWAKTNAYNPETKKYEQTVAHANVVSNELRPGFKVTDDVRRIYWGGGNIVWRVFDPAGFELEISSANLMAIIQVCGIQPGGIINGNCCWGRDGANNILLHESSDVYQNSFKNAEDLKLSKGVSQKDVVVGAKYILQNGGTAIYLGKFHVHTLQHAQNDHVTIMTPRSDKIFADLGTQQIVDQGVLEAIDLGGNLIKLYKKVKLVSWADDKDALSESEIMNRIEMGNVSFGASGKYSRHFHISRKQPNKLSFGLEPIDETTFQNIRNEFIRSKNVSYLFGNFNPRSKLPIGLTVNGQDDMLWGEIEQYLPKSASAYHRAFCPTFINGDKIQTASVKYALRQTGTMSKDVGHIFKMLSVPSNDCLLAWLDSEHARGMIQQIVVKESKT
jgi:hypothetical protein